MVKKILLLACMTFVMHTTAFSQQIHLGPQIGLHKAADADEGKIMAGVAMRMHITESFGVEASINYRSENYLDGALAVKSWPIMITALFYPIPIIYGAIGTGWYNTTFDYDQSRFPYNFVKDETQQNVGWHFGGGAELPVGATSLLTADLRYVFLNYDFKSVPGSGEKNSDFVLLTVGLLFSL